MNTNIIKNKLGLGLGDSTKTYMIKYNAEDTNVFKVQKTYLPEGKKERMQFKTIRNLTEYLYADGFEGFAGFDFEECPQILVNTFNLNGQEVA